MSLLVSWPTTVVQTWPSPKLGWLIRHLIQPSREPRGHCSSRAQTLLVHIFPIEMHGHFFIWNPNFPKTVPTKVTKYLYRKILKVQDGIYLMSLPSHSWDISGRNLAQGKCHWNAWSNFFYWKCLIPLNSSHLRNQVFI